jgi:cell wall-associated NlpC family hydrolase
MEAEEIVARARARVGVRFRPQGRSPESGLDCIGLVAEALGAGAVRADYPLRGGSAGRLEAGLQAAGLRRVFASRPGDVLVMRAGPEQLHLALLTSNGLVHADAGLRQVVERLGPLPWPVLSIWRLGQGGEGG